MNFYDREKEISRLREIEQTSRSNAQLSVVTGRRRIGKTLLLLRATKSEAEPVLYFFVARKAENFLCQDFQQEIAVKLGIPIMGEVSNFGKLFEYLMILSEQRAFTLIIDEFQEFLFDGNYIYFASYCDNRISTIHRVNFTNCSTDNCSGLRLKSG